MKRFVWPLQRLLDVTVRREGALGAGVMALSRQIAQLHQEIVHRRTIVDDLLVELARLDIGHRVAVQKVLMDSLSCEQDEIERHQEQLDVLRSQRSQQTATYLQARTKRQILEKRRDEAKDLHIRAELKHEQASFDESAQIVFARKAIEARAAITR